MDGRPSKLVAAIHILDPMTTGSTPVFQPMRPKTETGAVALEPSHVDFPFCVAAGIPGNPTWL
jgi:hypothetical protein